MGNKKTGFEKFIDKQFEDPGVNIVQPVHEKGARMTREERLRLVQADSQEKGGGGEPPETVKEDVKENAGKPQKRERGRPAMDPELKRNEEVLHVKIDRELKRKVEHLMIDTYRSSVKDLVVEALRDLLKKYGAE